MTIRRPRSDIKGLAWTPSGGKLYRLGVELTPGTGVIKTDSTISDETLGTICSALSALKAQRLVPHDTIVSYDFNIKFPEGLHGSSVGLALCLTLYASLKNLAIKENVGVTGQVDSRGKVKWVDGIKEKMEAAKEAGLQAVIMPRDNFYEADDLYPLYIHPVENLTEAIAVATMPK